MQNSDFIELEENRVEPENTKKKFGPIVSYKQAWRDIDQIPLSAPQTGLASTIEILGKNVNCFLSGIVKKYEKLPLQLVQKSDTFFSEYLKNLIPPSFSDDASYKIEFFYGDTEEKVPQFLGNYTYDNSAGTIRFDKEFIEILPKISIPLLVSFYRYEGRIGFYGTESEEQLPLRDDLPLIKSARDPSLKARFVIESDETEYYSLPKGNGKYQDKHNMLLTNESLEDTFKTLVKVDGAEYL